MAEKTVNSDFFPIVIDNVNIDRLRSQAVYSVNQQGVVNKEVQVNLLKEVTKEQYDALPDNARTTTIIRQTSSLLGGFPTIQNVLHYHAILATKESGERTYTTNKEVLDVIPLAKGATSVSVRATGIFNQEVAKFNNKGEGQFLNVNRNAQIAIIRAEGTEKVKNTELAGNAAQPPVERLDFNNFSGIRGNLDTNYSYEDKDKKIIADLRYPIDLNDKQDRIKFSMYEYGAKKLSNATNYDNKAVVTGFGERDYKPITGTVTLPIQGKITDSNVVNWGEGTINPLQAYGAKELMSLNVNNIAGSYKKVLGDIRTLFKNQEAMGDLATFLRTYFVEKAVPIQGLLSRTTGAILNPNVELLFQSPQLRSFNFSFFLSARSEEEAERVKRIIRYFKQGMSVKSTATDIFLKAPNIFRIEYVYGGNGNTHPGLNRIKECALKTCNVDYVPENSYMTFEDGTMTAYLVSLQFQELEPILEDDYRGDQRGKKSVIQKNEIGY